MRRPGAARSFWAVAILGIGGWLGCGAARAQVLPPTGVDTRVGDLRGYFEQAFGQVVPPEAATQGWTWVAGIDTSETYDTGVAVISHGNTVAGHDLITRISPSFGVSGDLRGSPAACSSRPRSTSTCSTATRTASPRTSTAR